MYKKYINKKTRKIGALMIDWINVNSSKIRRIAFNAELKMMYIDFVESTVDIPYQGISEATFKEFSNAKNIDNYYELFIKDKYPCIEFNTENKINCSL